MTDDNLVDVYTGYGSLEDGKLGRQGGTLVKVGQRMDLWEALALAHEDAPVMWDRDLGHLGLHVKHVYATSLRGKSYSGPYPESIEVSFSDGPKSGPHNVQFPNFARFYPAWPHRWLRVQDGVYGCQNCTATTDAFWYYLAVIRIVESLRDWKKDEPRRAVPKWPVRGSCDPGCPRAAKWARP